MFKPMPKAELFLVVVVGLLLIFGQQAYNVMADKPAGDTNPGGNFVNELADKLDDRAALELYGLAFLDWSARIADDNTVLTTREGVEDLYERATTACYRESGVKAPGLSAVMAQALEDFQGHGETGPLDRQGRKDAADAWAVIGSGFWEASRR